MKLDPATWREAARQLREEADLLSDTWLSAAREGEALRSMARRFENEARAAEKVKEEANG